MDRNRAPSTFHGALPPVYKNPADPLTPPLGTFETDPAQPPTPLTPEHMNLVTEELRNLVIATGLTPASNADNQLATAFADGTWIPTVLHGGSPAVGITYTRRLGSWSRKGRLLDLFFDVAWSIMTIVTPLALSLTSLPFPVASLASGAENYMGQLFLSAGVSATLDDLGFCRRLTGEQVIRLYSRSGAELISNASDSSGALIGSIRVHI